MPEFKIIMANNCIHTKCAVCGGFKVKSSYLGRIGTSLNDVCSPKCQVATKNICSCKCGGKFHKGANSSLLNKILNPPAKKPVKKVSKKKSYKANFEPQTLTDNIAVFLEGVRIKTSSFDRYSDRNYRKDNKKIQLHWLSKTGSPLDQLALDFLNEKGYQNYDEDDIIYAMVNYINDYPSGIKKYIEDIEAERIRENDYYNYLAPIEEQMQPEIIEDNYIRDEEGNIIFGNMTPKQKANQARFKKVMAEAKKLRAKNKTLTQAQAVKQAWSIMYSKGGKAGAIKILEKGESKSTKPKAYYLQQRTKTGAFKGRKKISGTDKVYIEFLNKDKGFIKDKKFFDTYNKALAYIRKNFDKADPDMIKYVNGTYLGATKVKAKKPKGTSEMHTDTKSHNVNIRVVSGLNQNLQTLNDIKYLMQRVEQYEKSIKILNTIPLKSRSRFDIMALSKYKQNLKSTKQALRELKKAIKF